MGETDAMKVNKNKSPDAYIASLGGARPGSRKSNAEGKDPCAKKCATAARLVEDAMHVLNEVLCAWLLLEEKRGLAVGVYSHRAIYSFSDTLFDGRAHFPGSLARSFLIVGS